jgi:hypothetical protein
MQPTPHAIEPHSRGKGQAMAPDIPVQPPLSGSALDRSHVMPDDHGDSTSGVLVEWEGAIHEIAATYSEVERRSLSIPGFSLAPLGIYFWASVKFVLLLYLDLFLFIPLNLVILMRNIFPGKWRYRSFSGHRIKLLIEWFRNGEVPIVAIVATRSLTYALLGNHFRNRLGLIRRRIMLECGLPEREQVKLISAIDKVLLQWPARTFWQGIFTYGLPLLSPLSAFYQLVFPGAPGVWTRLLVIVSLTYALAFLASAFIIKRGLMLGGVGRLAYFPGLLEGRGAYAAEKQILAKFGLAAREFPLGFVLSLILVPVSYLQALIMYETGLYAELAGKAAFSKAAYLAQSMSGAVLIALVGAIAVARRDRLGRC